MNRKSFVLVYSISNNVSSKVQIPFFNMFYFGTENISQKMLNCKIDETFKKQNK